MNFATVTVGQEANRVVVTSEGLRLEVPADVGQRLARHAGQKVTLGVRPEDVHIATAADSADQGIEALVEVQEMLGSEILLDTKVGKDSLVASVEPTVRVKIGDRLRLAAKPEKLHFFDAKTEAAI